VNSGVGATLNVEFQCSSASRKFSIEPLDADLRRTHRVSVLFSEPKILNFPRRPIAPHDVRVSVLFSEPKILNRK